jgi:hypothetical protein
MEARSGQNLLGDGAGGVDDRDVSVGGRQKEWGWPVTLVWRKCQTAAIEIIQSNCVCVSNFLCF